MYYSTKYLCEVSIRFVVHPGQAKQRRSEAKCWGKRSARRTRRPASPSACLFRAVAGETGGRGEAGDNTHARTHAQHTQRQGQQAALAPSCQQGEGREGGGAGQRETQRAAGQHCHAHTHTRTRTRTRTERPARPRPRAGRRSRRPNKKRPRPHARAYSHYV